MSRTLLPNEVNFHIGKFHLPQLNDRPIQLPSSQTIFQVVFSPIILSIQSKVTSVPSLKLFSSSTIGSPFLYIKEPLTLKTNSFKILITYYPSYQNPYIYRPNKQKHNTASFMNITKAFDNVCSVTNRAFLRDLLYRLYSAFCHDI